MGVVERLEATMAALGGLDASLVKGFLLMKPSPEELYFMVDLDFTVRDRVWIFECFVFKM